MSDSSELAGRILAAAIDEIGGLTRDGQVQMADEVATTL
jgi:hypothetical protein